MDLNWVQMSLSFLVSVLIASFEEAQSAQALKRRFERVGIKAELRSDGGLQSLLFWTKPSGAKKVYVSAEQLAHARAFLKEWGEGDGLLERAIRCPECRSTRVEYPQYTRKFAIPLLIEWMISLGAVEKDYYCLDCQYTWPREANPDRQGGASKGDRSRSPKPKFAKQH